MGKDEPSRNNTRGKDEPSGKKYSTYSWAGGEKAEKPPCGGLPARHLFLESADILLTYVSLSA